MGKIVFFCIPAHGHTNPTLGVVRELISRGNEVYYYSYECMREKIESTGAKFVACDQYDPQIGLSKEDGARLGKDLAFSTELIVELTLALDDAVLEEMKELIEECDDLMNLSIKQMSNLDSFGSLEEDTLNVSLRSVKLYKKTKDLSLKMAEMMDEQDKKLDKILKLLETK